MSTVTIIGTGNIGAAVAGIAAKAGAQLQILAREGEKAETVATPLGAASGTIGDELTGDIVVLALPYDAISQVLTAYGDAFDGRTVVDVTNPVDFATFDGLVVPADSSATRIIQEALSGASVVKAFNVNFGATLATGTAGPLPTTVLVAGDSTQAKDAVIALVTAGGLRGVDAGSLKRARELEALGFLQISLAAAEKTPWTGGFALIG
ncbi:NADPH-dependent F420 reductase [Microbacterium sp. ZW T5_45]|uniref:NADPH-dependent F420 reductase n=1 Tax=Microbacterium sp. ZW T5_45 TaxID=3378080 RepID=UPI003853B1E6